MDSGKRPGEDTAIPIASKMPRLSDDTVRNDLVQTGWGKPVLNRQPSDLAFPASTAFHLKIRICPGKYAALNGPMSPVQLDGETLNIEYFNSNISDSNKLWLGPMEAVVTKGSSSPDKPVERVGFCRAKLIRRKKIRGRFYRKLSERHPLDESTLLAFDLFDRFGNLKDDYENHAIRKGSFTWGARLNHGEILLIEDITIEKPYRRQGLGGKVVAALLETTKCRTTDGFAVILWPESSKDKHFEELLEAVVGDSGNFHRPAIFDHHDPEAIAWSRSLGFRRIGSSFWFGLACLPGLPMPDGPDYDPPVSERAVQGTLPKSIRGEASDSRFLQAAQQYLQHTTPDSQEWFATDKEANTLLHLAALYFLPGSVAWIMQQPASARLIALRNSSGNTPLEALLQKLEIVRTRSLHGRNIISESDGFRGHTVGMARCIALLKGVETDTDRDLEQFRYGCTCGECKDGYFSARMRSALRTRAAIASHALAKDLDNPIGNEWVVANGPIFDYLPPWSLKLLRRYKDVREGCMRLFRHITSCLDGCSVPNETNIRLICETQDTMPNYVEKFLKCGGTIEALMQYTFVEAFNCEETYKREDRRESDGLSLDCEEGDVCRNDREFVLVARKCGYEATATHLREFWP